MTFKELRQLSGMTQKAFSEYFEIPRRTIEDWDMGVRQCPEYLLKLMAYKLENIIFLNFNSMMERYMLPSIS